MTIKSNVYKQASKLIEIALALKDKHQTGSSFHVTGIFKKNRLISLGINNYFKTNPKTLKYNYHSNSNLHAEMSAIIKLGSTDCSKLVIINLRINNNNKIDYSYPCKGCINLINSLNFKGVYFSDRDGIIKEM